MHKRFLNFFLLLIFSGSFLGQQFNVTWRDYKTINFDNNQSLRIPKTDSYTNTFEANTVFITLQENFSQPMKAENLQWEEINESDLYDLTKANLPENVLSGSSVIKDSLSQKELYSVKISGITLQKGKIFRLKSFFLTRDSSSNSFLRSGSTENPLSQGKFYKIKVPKTGIFKITSTLLQQLGISTSGLNPKNLRVYGNGGTMLPEFNLDDRYAALQENAIQVVGEADGSWENGDYALFFAQGPDAYGIYESYNDNFYSRTDTRLDRSRHVKNIYEDFSYYFITFEKGPGKRVTLSNIPPAGDVITNVPQHVFLDEEKNNLLHVGRVFLGDAFTSTKTYTFPTNAPILPGTTVTYRARTVALNSKNNKINFSLNGVSNIPYTVTTNYYTPLTWTGTIPVNGNQLSFVFTPDVTPNPAGSFYIDYVEAEYIQALIYNGSQLIYYSPQVVSGSNETYTFSISNTSGMEQVWDVSDITNAKKIQGNTSGGNFVYGYTADSTIFNNRFIAFTDSSATEALPVGAIQNQNISALNNIQYLIISPDQLLGEAQRMATYHQNKEGFNVAIVPLSKIYNEFSSGSQDLTALRDFITKLNNPEGSLKYVLLMGDTSFDFKDRIPNNENLIPSYQSEASNNFAASFVTDDYIVMTKPQISSYLGSNLPDIPVGRLPAKDIAEAKVLVNKTLAYENLLPGQPNPFGMWRMKMDYVVDDDNDTGVPFHTIMNGTIVNVFETNTDKPEYFIKKLYSDAFTRDIAAGGFRYPQVNQAISNDISNTLVMFYLGHGGINGWAQERIFTPDMLNNFNNYNAIFARFPFVSTITCEFTVWDDPETPSLGERVVKLPTGGASGMITSSRSLGVDYGLNFTELYIKELFKLVNDDFRPLGDAHLSAKKLKGAQEDHFRVNTLADPAMKLSRPERKIVVDQIVTPIPGKIRALDFVKITGHIIAPAGGVLTSFNGEVFLHLYDKKLTKTTKNNSGNLVPILTFKEEGSPIVKTAAVVTNGTFTIEFYVPKDIDYADGDGRLLLYADNKKKDYFTTQTQIVGSINPEGINDNNPPQVRLFMNNTNFANGGITDQNPLFIACVTDDTGINSTGAGVGHDVIAYLDGQVINTIVLNEFYTDGDGLGCSAPNLKNYQKGYVSYPLRNLSPGPHQLTFRIWDINNNSTTSTLDFVVKTESAQKLTINRLLNWPNPFTKNTYIQFEHNCDDTLDVHAQIYTITGKLVRTLHQQVSSEPILEGFRIPRTAIMWDGLDDFGDVVAKGTYIFKIFAKSINQDKCGGAATAVQKMVLLK